MKLVYSDEAKKRLRFLPPETRKGIRNLLESLQNNPYLGKPLQRELTGFSSVRFKRCRIIYKVLLSRKEIHIYTLGPRKNIYREFRSPSCFFPDSDS